MGMFIAALVLIGVLAVNGGTSDKASTPALDTPPTTTNIENRDGEAQFFCGDAGPHQRDLTVPYVTRSPGASGAPGGRKDCRDD